MMDLSDGLSLSVLTAAAAIGFVHTLLGPDHWMPFVALARAQNWRLPRTLAVVAACGVAHVLGAALGTFEVLDSIRGGFAAWGMVLFGLSYAAWGLRRAWVESRGFVPHAHGEQFHLHRHGGASHVHGADAQDGPAGAKAVDEPGQPRTFWALFLLFVLGPCEPLIPLFVLPASRGRWDIALGTIAVFGVVTVATMLVVTTVGVLGARKIHFGGAERYAHAMAGGAVAASGLMVIGLGL
jgi:hypothetical protein